MPSHYARFSTEQISDFSKLCRVPVSTLRYYANEGLFEPAQIDPFTGYRYYTLGQLPRLNRILALRDLGLSLDQIRRLLEEAITPAEMRGMLRIKQAEIKQVVDEEQARLARVAARLKHIEQEGNMPVQEVVLKSIELQHVMSIRTVVAKPEEVATLLGEVCGALIGNGIQPTAPPFTIFHDETFKPTDMDVEIVVPVAKNVRGEVLLDGDNTRRIVAYDLSAVPNAATIIHKGDYESFDKTYAVIGQWIDSNGYRIAGNPREIYLSPPDGAKDAVTEIQFPVEKV
jgi:DNA-binding transcriptional MerR regulator